MVGISKESNKSGFILLETLIALSIVTVSIHFFSRNQLFLLKQDQEIRQSVRLSRILYEEVRAYRLYKGEKRRYRQLPIESTIEITEGNGIKKAVIFGESEVIEIERLSSY